MACETGEEKLLKCPLKLSIQFLLACHDGPSAPPLVCAAQTLPHSGHINRFVFSWSSNWGNLGLLFQVIYSASSRMSIDSTTIVLNMTRLLHLGTIKRHY